jgi:F-type H+-transporting ATPase subunit delta
MLANQLAFKYAQALYEIAAASSRLAEAEQQLRLIETTFSENTDLATFIYHPLVPAPAKKKTIVQVFSGELDEWVQNSLLLLIDKRRETALPAITHAYVQLANEARNIAEASVFTACELSPEHLNALTAKLSKITGKNIVLKTAIDRQLLGGVVVKIGDKLIDGSVAHQLKKLKTALVAGQAASGLSCS